jgi:hypothetical protein
MGIALDELSTKDLESLVSKKEKEFEDVLQFATRVTKALTDEIIEPAHNAKPYTKIWEVKDYFDFHIKYVEYTSGGAAAPPSYGGCTVAFNYNGKDVLYISKFPDNFKNMRLKQEIPYKDGPWKEALKELMVSEVLFMKQYKQLKEEAALKRWDAQETKRAEEHKRGKIFLRAQELGLAKIS